MKCFEIRDLVEFIIWRVDFVVVRKGNDEDQLPDRFDKESVFMDEVFTAAGLPLVQFEVLLVYSVLEIQKILVLSL